MDQRANDALFEAGVGRWRWPDGLQVGREQAERGEIDGGTAALYAAILLSTSVMSTLLQRASSSPVTSRFAGSAASYWGKARSGRVARRFEIATERIAHLIPPFSSFHGGGIRSRDGAWTDDANRRFLDGIVGANPPKAMHWAPLSIKARLQA